jgi:hypothetical protein
VHIEATIEESISNLSKLEISEATRIVKLLGKSLATTEMIRFLTKALTGKVKSAGTSICPLGSYTKPTATKNGEKCQVSQHTEHIMPTRVWDLLEDKKQSYWNKVFGMCNWCMSVGLVSGHEGTYVRLASIMILAHVGSEAQLQISTDNFYQLLNDLKNTIRNSTKRCKLAHFNQITMYPASTEEFQRDFPEIFKRAYPEGDLQNAPSKSRLDSECLSLMANRMPSRTTHHTLKQKAPTVVKQKSCFGIQQVGGQLTLADPSSRPCFRSGTCEEPSLPGLFYFDTPGSMRPGGNLPALANGGNQPAFTYGDDRNGQPGLCHGSMHGQPGPPLGHGHSHGASGTHGQSSLPHGHDHSHDARGQSSPPPGHGHSHGAIATPSPQPPNEPSNAAKLGQVCAPKSVDDITKDVLAKLIKSKGGYKGRPTTQKHGSAI